MYARLTNEQAVIREVYNGGVTHDETWWWGEGRYVLIPTKRTTKKSSNVRNYYVMVLIVYRN